MAQHEIELYQCPNCGDTTDYLFKDTGWCSACTYIHYRVTTKCPICRRPFARAEDQNRVITSEVCPGCGMGYRSGPRTESKCVWCGGYAKNLFCMKNDCRRAAQRYTYYVRKRGYSHEKAILRIKWNISKQ